MLVLGVDPGTLKSGISLMDDDKLIRHEQFKLGNSKQPIEKRLLKLQMKVLHLIHTNEVKCVVLEDGFIGTNKRTSMAICMSRAAVMIAAAMNDVPVQFYTPSEVKLAATGYGKASKEEIQESVKMRHGIESVDEDEADAIAIAYTHWVKSASRKENNDGKESEHAGGLRGGRQSSTKVSKRR